MAVDAKTVEEAKCATCANGKKVLIKDEDTGFVRCAFQHRFEWIAARMPCTFNPTKWVKDMISSPGQEVDVGLTGTRKPVRAAGGLS